MLLIFKGRKKNLKRKVAELLIDDRELNTLQIKDRVNEQTHHGTTVPELGNVLGKDPIFRKVKQIKIEHPGGRNNGNYKVFVWTLASYP